MLTARAKTGIAQPVEQIIYAPKGIDLSEFPFKNALHRRAIQHRNSIVLRGPILDALTEFLFPMAGEFGRLPRTRLVKQRFPTALIILGHPLLNGTSGRANDLHNLRARPPHLGQAYSLNPPSQPCIHLCTIERLQFFRRVMRNNIHSSLPAKTIVTIHYECRSVFYPKAH